MEMADVQQVVAEIVRIRSSTQATRAVLAAVSGIDGCGKGYITAQIVAALESLGTKAVAINIDGWLNLPRKRFDSKNPATHFYLHAIRFEEMFARLVLPLRDQGSVHLVADHVEETAREYSSKTYDFNDVDVVVLEGIYLLKRAFVAHYDL